MQHHATHDAMQQSNSGVVCFVGRNGIGYATAEFSRDELQRLMDDPEAPLRAARRDVIKSGRSAFLVRVELPVGGMPVNVAYKRVRRRTLLKQLTVLLRKNRTLRTWHLGHELLRRGIATARPLVAIVPHRFNLERPSYIIHEWIGGGKNLRDWCWWAAELPPELHRRALRSGASSLGRLLGTMHAQNVSHRDLKPGNLLLVLTERDVESYVIDLDGVALHRGLPRQIRLRNLSRVVVGFSELPPINRTICLRFLRAYLCTAGDSAADWKEVWRTLQKTGSDRLARKLRKAA